MVEQLRAGHLSPENQKYLHGQPVEGCCLSPEERRSRKRVIDGPDDERLTHDRFRGAPVIVANNDARYQINKHRAMKYFPRWAYAVDRASSKALQAEACDKEAKKRRLG